MKKPCSCRAFLRRASSCSEISRLIAKLLNYAMMQSLILLSIDYPHLLFILFLDSDPVVLFHCTSPVSLQNLILTML